MSDQPVDEAALGAWLEANVEGFRSPFELTKFPSGQSNPTYRLDTPGRALGRAPFLFWRRSTHKCIIDVV